MPRASHLLLAAAIVAAPAALHAQTWFDDRAVWHSYVSGVSTREFEDLPTYSSGSPSLSGVTVDGVRFRGSQDYLYAASPAELPATTSKFLFGGDPDYIAQTTPWLTMTPLGDWTAIGFDYGILFPGQVVGSIQIEIAGVDPQGPTEVWTRAVAPDDWSMGSQGTRFIGFTAPRAIRSVRYEFAQFSFRNTPYPAIDNVATANAATSVVPEPGTTALVAGGLLALGVGARRRRTA